MNTTATNRKKESELDQIRQRTDKNISNSDIPNSPFINLVVGGKHSKISDRMSLFGGDGEDEDVDSCRHS